MSFLLAAVTAVTATPVPSPTPIVQVIHQIKEVPVTPEYINQLVMVGLLGLAGFLGSWIQAFINAHKSLGEKVNVLVTAFYTIAGAAIVLYQDGQLDFSNPAKLISSVAVVLLAAWVRHNGGKLTKPSTQAADGSGDTRTVAEATVVPRKATL